MRRNFLTAFFVGAVVLLSTAVVFAHHSQSGEFDQNKPIEFTGTVKAVEWTNPHGYVRVEVKEPNGKVTVYRAEIQAPNGLYRAGWTKDSVKPGTVVSFKGRRARNPESMNVSGRLAMPDGKALYQGQGPTASN
ncbi:MAG TPA: DUF6152 family protein [Terriglobia bacterium]|nr:DUF6152 family protein [Terriglobia bacterium]